MGLKIGALSKKQSAMYLPFLGNAAAEHLHEKNVQVVGAFEGKTLVGVMTFLAENPARIYSIAVSPEYQRQGVGSALCDSLAGRLCEAGAMGMEAFVFETQDDAFAGISHFLWRCGFTESESYADYELTLGEVAGNKEFVRLEKQKRFQNMRFLSELTDVEKRNLGNMLAMEAEYTDFPRKGLDASLSTVYEKNGKALGCALMGTERDKLLLHFIFLSNRADDKTALIKMLSQTLTACREKYGDDKKVSILAVEEKGEKLASFFFADSKGANRLHRFTFGFSKEKEAAQEQAAIPVNSEKKERRPLGTDPIFMPLTNNDILCRDCIYRIPNAGVSVCHKYDHKPDAVIGNVACAKYRKEVGE